MSTQFTDDQLAVRDLIRRVAREKVAARADEIDRTAVYPQDMFDMLRELGLRHGVVINRADSGDQRVREYCKAEAIPVLLELPDDRRVAEAYARGQLALDAEPEWRLLFVNLWKRMEGLCPSNVQ